LAGTSPVSYTRLLLIGLPGANYSHRWFPQAEGARLKCLSRPRAGVIDHWPTRFRFELPLFVPLPLLATAAKPWLASVGGAAGVAYVMVIVQVAPRASVAGSVPAPQDVPVKLNNPDAFPIPATVSAVIVTGVGEVTAALFVIVTTLMTGARGDGIVKVRMRAPPALDSDALVAAVKANGPAATPLPERLTVPVEDPPTAV